MQGSEKNHFICLLGIDGCGKTALLKAVTTMIPKYKVIDWHQFRDVTKVPTLAPDLRMADVLLQLGPHSRAAILLYLITLEYDLAIQPAVNASLPVIVDSYWYKIAAKELLLGISPAFLYAGFASLPKPEKIILLDTPPEVAFQRKQYFTPYECNGSPSDFIYFQSQARLKMLELIADIPYVLLDGRCSVEELASRVIQECTAIFPATRKMA